MTTIRVLSDEFIAALQRDHEQLRVEVRELRNVLRSLRSELGDDQLRPVCRFTLNAALATTDASKAATITHQYGTGRLHASTSITVQNFSAAVGGNYEYHGASGASGKAFYDPHTKTWHIFDMECPGT
jgi:hypothetical protein